MKTVEFTIESLPELEFRISKISPVDLLAITTQIDFEKFQQTKVLYQFALEHIDVKQGEKWFPVKLPNQEIYTPTTIEDNLSALNDLVAYFLNEVIAKTFTESSK